MEMPGQKNCSETLTGHSEPKEKQSKSSFCGDGLLELNRCPEAMQGLRCVLTSLPRCTSRVAKALTMGAT